MSPRRPLLIAGPTASGKSALAVALAERDGGVVINADASQVYACWRILTARPDEAELARAPHLLYGHVACDTSYSVGHWLRDATAAISDAERAGLRPIVVGGTGLYFHALTEGLARIPPIPPGIRARSASMDLAAMRDRLDPETAGRIDLRNPMRVQRAWEVLVATGRGLWSWQSEATTPTIPSESAFRVVVEPATDNLNRLIAARFNTMLEHGALDEVRACIYNGLAWTRPAGRVLGARDLRAYLGGEISLQDATTAAVTATRRFAKRQRTWFRSKMADWHRLEPERALSAIPED